MELGAVVHALVRTGTAVAVAIMARIMPPGRWAVARVVGVGVCSTAAR